MSIPSVVVANDIPLENAEPHVIIYKIRENVTNKNILNYVEPSTNADKYVQHISTSIMVDV